MEIVNISVQILSTGKIESDKCIYESKYLTLVIQPWLESRKYANMDERLQTY